MHLSEAEIGHIRESMRWLEPEVERVAPKFYENLFRRAPALRPMFRDDLSGQGMRFMSAVRTIADHLEDPDGLSEYVSLLARGHAAFGISAPAYHAMEEALIDTFRAAMGARFIPEMQLAWRHAFRQIGKSMLEQSGSDPEAVRPVLPVR